MQANRRTTAMTNSNRLPLTVAQRLIVATGFAAQHRTGSDLQISTSVKVLLDTLSLGGLVSDAIILADANYRRLSESAKVKSCIKRKIAHSPIRFNKATRAA